MEMQILTALVDLVKQGGQMALWGVAIYLILQLAKVVVIWGSITLIVRLICSAVFKGLGMRLLIKRDSISLMSDKATNHLSEAMTKWSNEVSEVILKLETRLNDLLKSSEKKEEKTTV